MECEICRGTGRVRSPYCDRCMVDCPSCGGTGVKPMTLNDEQKKWLAEEFYSE